MSFKALLITLWIGMSLCLNTAAIATSNQADSNQITPTQVNKAIQAAEKARKKAASVDGEWRDTNQFIRNARQALEKGNLKKAIKLAKKAEQEGKMGYEQAQSQRKITFPGYLTQ